MRDTLTDLMHYSSEHCIAVCLTWICGIEENDFAVFQISEQIQATSITSTTYKIFRYISAVYFKVVLRPLPIKTLKSTLHINKFNASWFAQQTL